MKFHQDFKTFTNAITSQSYRKYSGVLGVHTQAVQTEVKPVQEIFSMTMRNVDLQLMENSHIVMNLLHPIFTIFVFILIYCYVNINIRCRLMLKKKTCLVGKK